MALLDSEAEKWCCFKDDQIWLGAEKRWVEKEENIRGFKRLSQDLILSGAIVSRLNPFLIEVQACVKIMSA
jgi:hypothetical protein